MSLSRLGWAAFISAITACLSFISPAYSQFNLGTDGVLINTNTDKFSVIPTASDPPARLNDAGQLVSVLGDSYNIYTGKSFKVEYPYPTTGSGGNSVSYIGSLNDNDQYIGYFYYNCNFASCGGQSRAEGTFLYSGGAYSTDIPSGSVALNNDGAIVGLSSDRSIFIYKDGTYEYIPQVPGNYVDPIAINNSDQILGVGKLTSPGGPVITLAVPGATVTMTAGINDEGEVDGLFYDPISDPKTYQAFLYKDGIYTVVPAPPGFGYREISNINDLGQIFGNLVPIPEPPVWIMLLLGFGGFGALAALSGFKRARSPNGDSRRIVPQG